MKLLPCRPPCSGACPSGTRRRADSRCPPGWRGTGTSIAIGDEDDDGADAAKTPSFRRSLIGPRHTAVTTRRAADRAFRGAHERVGEPEVDTNSAAMTHAKPTSPHTRWIRIASELLRGCFWAATRNRAGGRRRRWTPGRRAQARRCSRGGCGLDPVVVRLRRRPASGRCELLEALVACDSSERRLAPAMPRRPPRGRRSSSRSARAWYAL